MLLPEPRRRPLGFAFSLGIIFATLCLVHADSVVTDPVGFTATSCLSNSDTLVSVPFTRPQAFVGAVQSINGGAITVSGAPGWTTNQFVFVQGTQPNHYYVLLGPALTSNPKEGHMYPVTANTSDTLTLDLTGDNLTGLPTGAQVIVIPYWTLATVFPSTDANVSFTPTTSTRSFKTEILIPNYTATKINPPPAATYFYSNNVSGTTNNIGWRIFGDNFTDHGNDLIQAGSAFIIRKAGNGTGQSIFWTNSPTY